MLCADQTITPNPENTGLGSMASRYPDSVPRWSDSTRYRVRCEVPTQAELPVTSEIFPRRNTWRKKDMDAEGLSIICAGIGYADEDENGAIIGYTKGEY
ncbi:hypothetical protein BHE74_00054295 [Ensete ventricosum]|nr:hypothetical protein BHE74_00054295 [Ensete ventricosum]